MSSPTSKICTLRRKIKRYTRTELEEMAIAKGKTRTQVRRLSYVELCHFLSIPTDNSKFRLRKKSRRILKTKKTKPPSMKTKSPTKKTPSKKPVKKQQTKKQEEGCIPRSYKTIHAHQRRVVEFLQHHRGLLVFHKVGSGKTLTAVVVSQCYLDQFPTHHVIVVAPAGLLDNFKKEMETSYKNLKHRDRYRFYSYQKFVTEAKKRKTNCRNTLLIIDEAHNLRTPFNEKKKEKGGITTAYLTACARSAHKVLLLTGTPLYNNYKDVFTLYNMVRSDGSPEIPYAVIHRRTANDSDLIGRMRCLISYYDPGESPKFPTRTDKNVYIDMSPEYEKKYKNVVESILESNCPDFLKAIFGGDKNLVAFFNGVRRSVNNLDNSQANNKLAYIVRKLESTPRHEKTLVFSNFLDAGVRLITKALPGKIKYAIIDGSISPKKRQSIVDEFNQDKIQVLFISKAGGEGLDLKGVRRVYIMEPTWNQAGLEQVIGRARRYESHAHLPEKQRNVKVYHLLHIFDKDKAQLTPIREYLNKIREDPIAGAENKDYPITPYGNSFDLFLSMFLKRKQIILDHHLETLKRVAIENQSCP